MRSLAVIRTDGSGKRTISGDLVGVAGPDTWSPDGTWIYFDANPTLGNREDNGVYRANVAGGFSQLLIGNGLGLDTAFAPASSPDGTLIVFIVPRSDGQATDLYIANSDGSGCAPAAGARDARRLVGGRTLHPHRVDPGRPTRRPGRHHARWKRFPGVAALRRLRSAWIGLHRRRRLGPASTVTPVEGHLKLNKRTVARNEFG